MEDSNKLKSQPNSTTPARGRIIDLTPDLEIRAGGTQAKIIELTQMIDSPSDASAVRPPVIPAAPAPQQPAGAPHHVPAADPSNIEADVSAAFDAIQAKKRAADLPPPSSDDGTFELRPVADPDPVAEASDTESVLALTIDDLALDTDRDLPEEAEEEPELELSLDLETEQPPAHATQYSLKGPGTVYPTADKTLELTDIVIPTDLRTKTEARSAATPAAKHDAAGGADAPAFNTGNDEPIDLEDDDAPIDLIDMTDPDDVRNTPAQTGVLPSDAPDDDAIELTDIVPWDEPEAADDEEEEVIELTDIVDPAEVQAAHAQTGVLPIDALDDEALELTDIVARTQADAGDDAEEEVIVLQDRVEEPEQMHPLAAHAASPLSEADDAQDDQVIRLDQVMDRIRAKKSDIARDISIGIEEELAAEPPLDDERGIAVDMDIEEMSGRDSRPIDRELERTIEQIIRTKYAKTIEELIAKAVEKVVTREMESLKRDLMEGED